LQFGRQADPIEGMGWRVRERRGQSRDAVWPGRDARGVDEEPFSLRVPSLEIEEHWDDDGNGFIERKTPPFAAARVEQRSESGSG